jgi:WD40 repeat protein
VSFSADGKLLASGCEVYSNSLKDLAKGEVLVWDAVTGKHSFTLRLPASWVKCLALSPNGKWLAVGGSGNVTVWDMETRKQAYSLPISPMPTTNIGRVRIDFSADGNSLAAGCADGSVRLWDLMTGEVRLDLKGAARGGYLIALSRSGSLVATAHDQMVQVWNLKSGKLESEMKGHAGVIFSVDFSPDGRRLVSADQHGVVKVWDVSTGTARLSRERDEPAKQLQFMGMVFSPDGQRLAAGSNSSAVTIFDATTGEKLHTLIHDGRTFGVAFSADGLRLASASELGTVKVWDTQSGREVFTTAHPDAGRAQPIAP